MKKKKDHWRIVRDFKTVQRCVNGRWVFDSITIKCESLRFCRDAWLSLDIDMIRIDDEVRQDAILNPARHVPQDIECRT